MPQTYTLEQALQDKDDETRLQVGNDLDVEYDHAKRVLNLAGRSGLPYEVINSNPDAVEEAVGKADFDAKRWMKESPEFAKFAAKNPYHLSVLKMDEENLSWFEREWKRPMSLALQGTAAKVELNQIGNRRAKGREYWLDSDEDRMEELRGQIQEHDYGASGSFRPVIWAAKEIGPMAYTIWSSKEEALAGAVLFTAGGMKIGGGAGSLLGPPGAVAGVGIGGATGFFSGLGVGAAIGGGEATFEMMRGEQYNRYIQAGFSHEEAARVSLITGSVSALPELAGIGKLVKNIPGIDKALTWGSDKIAAKMASDVLVKPSVRQATGRLVGRWGTNMGIEISTEIFQDTLATVGQNYLAAEADKPEAHVSLEQWQSDMANTFVQTAKGMLIISSVGPGMAYTQDLRRASRSKDNERGFTALAAAINGSKTRTEAPETFRAFVEQVKETGGQILMGAEQWDTFWQGKNEDPDAMAERLGMDMEELRLAREAGHDVEIPAVAFAEQLAPSALFDEIMPDLKFHENDMTARERELFNANKPQIVRDIEASLDELKDAESKVDADAIIQDVTGQLIAAQFEEGASGHLAQLYRGFGVVAERLGKDPQELFERFFGGVRRMTPEALERSKVSDPSIDPLLNRLRRQDFPSQREMYGISLLEFLRDRGGVQDTGGELSGRDIKDHARGLMRASGMTIDEAAEAAAESGFIAEDYTENSLLEAIDREIGGEPVFGVRDEGDTGMREINAHMDRLAEMISELGIDLDEMSNEDIRAALEAADTYDQELSGDKLRSTLAHLAEVDEGHGGDANEIDGILARAEVLMPLIYQEQDFGDLELTDTVTVEGTGETVEITEDAQAKFDRAIERKETMKKLLDCVSG